GVVGLPQCRRRPRHRLRKIRASNLPGSGTWTSSVSANEPIRPPEHFVYVLDHDAGLRAALPESQRARARQHAVAGVIELQVGDWDPATDDGSDAELGLLLLEGLMIRDVTIADARCGELVGPGVLLRPCDNRGSDAPMRHEVGWRVVEPTRLAVLDRRFVRVAAHWPTIMTALVARATERAHNLGVMVSIHSLKRVDARLLAFLRHLAARDARRARAAAPRRARQLAAGVDRPLRRCRPGHGRPRRRRRRGRPYPVVSGGASAEDGVAERRTVGRPASVSAGVCPIAISSSTSASAAVWVRSPWRRIERAA